MDQVRRYLGQVKRSYGWYQRTTGTTVPWYEFDRAASGTAGDLYDESPNTVWKPPFMLPILHAARVERAEQPREEGFYSLGNMHLTISAEQAANAGMSDPWDADLHLFDRYEWDGRYWEVRTWQIQGRLRRAEVIIGVSANEVADEELVNTNFPEQ